MYCSGARLLVEAKTFKEIGGFDTSLAPAYCEDWDFAFRLPEHGLRVMYNPKSVIIHHLSVTSTRTMLNKASRWGAWFAISKSFLKNGNEQ
jgi:GT2 family glycosyltransferase